MISFKKWFEATAGGLFVGLKLEPSAAQALFNWISPLVQPYEEFAWPSFRVIPPDKLHATIVMTQAGTGINEFVPAGKVNVMVSNLALRIIKTERVRALSLVFSCPWMVERSTAIRQQLGLKPKQDFLPHLALCYNFPSRQIDINKLKIPISSFSFVEEYSQPFIQNWAAEI